MAWSTREMADLAGVSLRAVRHYHDIGLLDEPERRSNGYKQYGVSHLVRLLRIKRLTALGFSLSQIAHMDDDPDSIPIRVTCGLLTLSWPPPLNVCNRHVPRWAPSCADEPRAIFPSASPP